MSSSLWRRLLAANLILLPLFMGLTMLYLERSFRISLESAANERLQIQVLTLLAEADYGERLVMPVQLLESRFNQANSGLYAVVTDAQGRTLWSSPSLVDLTADVVTVSRPLDIGEQRFVKGEGLYRFSWAVLWLTESGAEISLVFSVAEDTRPTVAQIASYRRSLLLWLGAGALVLLLGQLLVMYWGLRPLRRLADDIAAIESGEKSVLAQDYPLEVRALTQNLSSLLASEKDRRQRTRNTLSDLAHSLKMPLSTLRSADADDTGYAVLVDRQIVQMEEIVGYHLQRASGGTHNLMQLVALAPLVDRLIATVERIYADKRLQIETDIVEGTSFRGDERDALELLGNLIDNACKYGGGRVRISGRSDASGLELAVEDDGPGIAPRLREKILQRGVRADSFSSGQGIGLAVTADLAASYNGRFSIENSSLGGAKVVVFFPGAQRVEPSGP